MALSILQVVVCLGGQSDESGSLGVFLSSISRNRLDVEFGLGKCMKYFSSDLVILVVDGGTFDQLRHMRNIGWILRNVGQTCRYLVD